MEQALILAVFLSAVVVLSLLAKRLRIPYPIAFVIGGTGLGLTRHLTHPTLDPDIVLLVVLPPLLYSAAWSTDWFEMRRNWRPISLLAIGLVLFTTVIVAVVVHGLIPNFGWAVAFTLGAIVSPPDAVAAEAIFERLAIPRRVAAIISGECLVNDATALVLYRFALAAAVSGTFSIVRAGAAFVMVAIGGILVGIVIALLLEAVLRYVTYRGLDDATTAGVIFLLAPFAAYLPAEALHCSGVLATVAAGILLSQRSTHFIDSETRVLGASVWRMLTFILNALAFLLIGLQLPSIVSELEPNVGSFVAYGLLVSVTVIAVRIAWVFAATYVPLLVPHRRRGKDPRPTWQALTVVSWAGMRGIVSLAAALALPYTLGANLFPQRSVAIFFTLCVVVVTLVIQGLTLGPLIEWLGVSETSKNQQRETKLRIRALEAGVARLKETETNHKSAMEWEIAGRILEEYQQRINLLRGKGTDGAQAEVRESRIDRQLQKEALAAERRTIIAMRRAGDIPDDIYRSIEYDLDLADLRLS